MQGSIQDFEFGGGRVYEVLSRGVLGHAPQETVTQVLDMTLIACLI